MVNVKLQLQRARLCVAQLAEVADERSRLRSLELTPLARDNADLESLALETQKALLQLLQDAGENPDAAAGVAAVAEEYAGVLKALESDPAVDVGQFAFKVEFTPKKTVRFQDNPDDAEMRSQLMGTAQFRPYTDDDENTLLSVDTTNQTLFAQSQQLLMAQDEDLGQLHQLIKIQHAMGLDMNEELDNHLVLLNDLERGVDGSSSRLRRANAGIRSFRRKVQENGSLVTIVVLTVILVLLLVVLN